MDLESLPVAFRREGQHRKKLRATPLETRKTGRDTSHRKAGSILIGPEPNSVGTPGLKTCEITRKIRCSDHFWRISKSFHKRDGLES